MGTSFVSPQSPCEKTRLSSADNPRWRCRRTTQAQKGRIDRTETPAGSRLRRRVHRRGPPAGYPLPLRKKGRILRGVSRATRRERIRSERKAEGNERSGWRLVPVASLHRDLAALTLESRVGPRKWICISTETDGANSQPGMLPRAKNPHPRATQLQGQGQGPAVHARYDRGVLGKSGRIAEAISRCCCAETASPTRSGTRGSGRQALWKSRGHDSGSCFNDCRAKTQPGRLAET